MSEKKYLLFTLEYPPFKGGIAEYYKNLTKFWPEDNFLVLADEGNLKYGQVVENDNIKYQKLISKHLHPHSLPAFWHLYRQIAKLRSQTPNLHVIAGQTLPLGIVVYFIAKLIKFKYSVILHGMDFSMATTTKRKRKLTGMVLGKADKIICANSYTANLVKSFNGNLAEKISIVNPAIEPLFIRNPQRARELQQKFGLENKIVLLSLGRLVLRKGFDRVIEAMNLIIRSNQDIVYVIAGDGPDADILRKATNDLPDKIKNKIIFTGLVSDTDRWAWLELCDIFIMPSRNIDGDFEGFGTVYLEANLAGKPVIAGDSGGVRDAVINNINGLLVNPESVEEIAAAVIKLANDEKLRTELGEQGKRRVVENFNAKKLVDKLYRELIH